MSGRYLLDTNIVIALIGGDAVVRDQIAAADEVFIPSPTLGELYFGAFQSTHSDKNLALVDALANSYAILAVDQATAKIFGQMQQALRKIGKPIPVNDVWIAATARQWTATVATRDDHFALIAGLSTVCW